MPTLPPPKEAGNFEPVTDGTHLAICFMFVEYGSHQEMYKGKPKQGLSPTCRIGWEICDEDMSKPNEKTGEIEPKVLTKRYTWSMSEKAILRKDLEAWRGQRFVEADFGPAGFNVRKLIGAPAMLTVANTQKGDKSYCDIIGMSRLYKGIQVPPPRLKPIYVALNKEEWDSNAFDKLSDKAKAFIKASPEYQNFTGDMSGAVKPQNQHQQQNNYAQQSQGRYRVDDPALNAAARGLGGWDAREDSMRRDAGYTEDPDRGGSDPSLDDEIPFMYSWK